MQSVKSRGADIPALGFGCFELEPEDTKAMVKHALQTGYRHIDTAQIYENEKAVGAGLAASGISRADIFLTTKIWTDHFADGDLPASAKDSLKRLDTDYVDLLLLHWPNPDVPMEEALGALADTKRQGLARHIGVSNFTLELFDQAQSICDEPLVTNQIEFHPFLDQRPMLNKLREHDVALTAYCPLAQGRVFNHDTLKAIGKQHNKNGGQVALRWLLQQGAVAIPRSSKPEHVESNLEVFDFELSAEQMRAITDLAESNGRIIDPSFAPNWD